jgi:hypothetical protein
MKKTIENDLIGDYEVDETLNEIKIENFFSEVNFKFQEKINNLTDMDKVNLLVFTAVILGSLMCVEEVFAKEITLKSLQTNDLETVVEVSKKVKKASKSIPLKGRKLSEKTSQITKTFSSRVPHSAVRYFSERHKGVIDELGAIELPERIELSPKVLSKEAIFELKGGFIGPIFGILSAYYGVNNPLVIKAALEQILPFLSNQKKVQGNRYQNSNPTSKTSTLLFLSSIYGVVSTAWGMRKVVTSAIPKFKLNQTKSNFNLVETGSNLIKNNPLVFIFLIIFLAYKLGFLDFIRSSNTTTESVKVGFNFLQKILDNGSKFVVKTVNESQNVSKNFIDHIKRENLEQKKQAKEKDHLIENLTKQLQTSQQQSSDDQHQKFLLEKDFANCNSTLTVYEKFRQMFDDTRIIIFQLKQEGVLSPEIKTKLDNIDENAFKFPNQKNQIEYYQTHQKKKTNSINPDDMIGY